MRQETMDSLILDFLPPLGYKFELSEDCLALDATQEVYVFLYNTILTFLRKNASFNIPQVYYLPCKLDLLKG